MANGIKALRKIQLGREVTAGGSTDPASTIWRGMGVLTDNRETVFSEEDIGILGGTTRTFVPRTGGEIALEGDATFEQLPHIFDAGIYKATPTTDASSGFIYSYIMASQSTDLIATTDLQTYVIEGGDNNEAEVMRYCFVREFGLSGAAGEALQVSGTFQGREVTGGHTYTAALSIPEVETVLVSKGKLYIDDSTGTIGTTLKSATLLGMDLSVTTGWQAVHAADGRLDHSFIKRANDEGTLQLTFEHNGTATAEKAAWRSQTERAVRLIFEGSALGTTDTYSAKTLVIDAYGKWESFEALSEQDGNDTVAGTLRIRYSPTAAKKLDIVVVNELSAMP
jgi:hypothetical protein